MSPLAATSVALKRRLKIGLGGSAFKREVRERVGSLENFAGNTWVVCRTSARMREPYEWIRRMVRSKSHTHSSGADAAVKSTPNASTLVVDLLAAAPREKRRWPHAAITWWSAPRNGHDDDRCRFSSAQTPPGRDVDAQLLSRNVSSEERFRPPPRTR